MRQRRTSKDNTARHRVVGPTSVSPSPSISESPTPTGTAPEDPEEAEQDIREAWRVFFDPESSLDERSEVVETGEQNALMIDNLFYDPLGSRLRADVTSVSFASDLHADVAYTLTRDGRRLDTGGPGAAILQDGTWKIALRTVCDLTRHAEDAPEAKPTTAAVYVVLADKGKWRCTAGRVGYPQVAVSPVDNRQG